MNSKIRRALLLACCAVLLVAMSVGATLAYLTSTDTVTNTFTVGNVTITLDETEVDVYGVGDGTTRVEANTYKLLPGHKYIKDPIVHVQEGSEKCYVRVLVTVSNMTALTDAFPEATNPTYYNGDLFLLQSLVEGWSNDVWQYVGYDEGTYEFRYVGTQATDGVVDARTAAKDLEAVFSHVVIPGNADQTAIDKLDGVQVTVVAHAIQADGFENAADAWAKW